jgi:integrase
VASEPVQAALRLTLLLGGQRPAQLLRLERGDVDLQCRTIRLFDPKGRRSDPRVHELPLTDAAIAILAPLLDRAQKLGCAWMFTADGERRRHPDTVTTQVRYISTDMTVAGEAKADFQLRDLRRTCETMLAAMGVSRDVRAQLLSHGLSGVQHVHYDRHDYAAEKRALPLTGKVAAPTAAPDAIDTRIVQTLRTIVPSASASYEQAVCDLQADARHEAAGERRRDWR